MRKFRDTLDTNDVYWPRMRYLHALLWSKGIVEAKNTSIVWTSIAWLLLEILSLLFSLAWRGAALLGGLLFVDRVVASGVVRCVMPRSVGDSEVVSSIISQCTVGSFQSPTLILIIILIVTFLFIYPPSKFLKRLSSALFWLLNIVFLGYPLKFIAYLVSRNPKIGGKWLDKSYILGAPSTAMSDIFPHDYKYEIDNLWRAYHQSESSAGERELEETLKALETKYPRL